MKRILPLLISLMVLPAGQTACASIAYGSINNFDTVNDTGHVCHGFEIEIEECRSIDITYTYNYNHYGVPRIEQDDTIPGHPKCRIRWESKKNADGSWASYTAVPSGPIAPTNGHMFTNPSVNFGGEHFGVGYSKAVGAIKYNWLIDSGSGTLIYGGAVQVATPVFTYFPPVAVAPAQVQAVIQPPVPPAPPVKEFAKAVWVKEIKTTTHNNKEIKLRELVSDDPADANDKNWANGEPDEIEVEWRILQRKTSAADGGPNGELAAAPEDLPGGDEVVTRRYEFYKYTGPQDAETGEAMADAVAADGVHGTGSRTYADHFDNATGEWVTVTKDMATFEIVGAFTGSQMAAVDVDAPVGLIDHVSEGRINTGYAARKVVVQGALPFTAVKEGSLPPGMAFDEATGVLSGTPTASGTYQFKVTASDGLNPDVAKRYTLKITAAGVAAPPASLLDTTMMPAGSGTTTGDGSYAVGANATVTATPAAGFLFQNWTDNGTIVSTNSSYTLAMDVNHSLVANFVPDVVQWAITTTAAPLVGGTVSGGGLVDDGTSTTVIATPNVGYIFSNWTEGMNQVSSSASYTFTASADRDLVANFTLAPTYTVSASAAAGGTVTGSGNFLSGASCMLTATPNAGYAFVNWTDGGAQVSTNAAYTFNVTANRTLVANFIPLGGTTYSITTAISPVAGGTISGAGTYASGSSVTVVAIPAAGYLFSKWKEGGTQVSSSASYTFTATANRTLTATFVRVYYITTSPSPAIGGTTETDSSSYKLDENARLDAFPNAGYQFVSWTENGNVVSNANPYSFKVAGDRTIVANFAAIGGVSITTSSAPIQGGTTTGGGSYLVNDTVAVQATASNGYIFSNWTLGGVVVSTDSTYSFTASLNAALVANFVPGLTVTTSSAPVAGGSTSGAGSFVSGTSVTLTATTNPGYTFVNWTEGGVSVSASPVYTFTISVNRTLVANFASGYIISTNASPAAGGAIGGGGTYAPGANVTLTATANPGYNFINWTDSLGTVVSTSTSHSLTATANGIYTANFELIPLGITFDFDTAAPVPAANTLLPLIQTNVGYTATFSSPVAEAYQITTESASGRVLSKFSGHYLEPLADNAVLVIQLNQSVTGVSLDFATVEALTVDVASNLQITAYDTSSGVPVSVGSGIAHGTVSVGDTLPVGTLNFNSAAGSFDQIVLQLPDAPVGSLRFLVDNIKVSPTASTGGSMQLANPNWNITLTDFGYSDFLLDNTPGFEGREYLSGEWGSAVAYTRGNGHHVPPTWLEPNFLFPDWKTNSDYHVVQGIHVIGNNLDGLPIAQSVISNGELEITFRFEMVDTVTGTPMGVKPASAAGGGLSVNSNRYVMNQTFTVKNITASAITNVQLFHLLHGFISQRGQYDNRSYPGKLPQYQYDITMSGIDGGAAGNQSSSIGLEDLIGFHSKMAPSSFEIGHYGIEGNGIDDHSSGKPSDGVHLSIEDNWENAPYLARKNRDSFAPTNRWIAGAQRWELGSIAAGQSVSFDIVLSLLTGTKVVVNSINGGTSGGGSCNGGSGHTGGVDFEFEDIDQEGTFFGEYSEADDDEINEREIEGEFTAPAFQLPNGTRKQRWNLTYSGSHTGNIKLKFAYNPALLPAGYDENQLVIYHFHNGQWEKLICKVNPSTNVIEAMTPSLSPFMLGVNDLVVKPEVAVSVSSPGSLDVSWAESFLGWQLQDSSDLSTWTNTARPVVNENGVSHVSFPSNGGIHFFRLIRP